MSAATKTAGHGAQQSHGQGHGHDDEAAHIKHYTKIYVTLLVLFGISVTGPVIGDLIHNKPLVLVTAFGIAVVKAYLVCSNFMHLNVEKKYIGYLLTTTVVFMFLFYAGVAPDVMEHHGRNWENIAAKNEVERALKANAEHAAHGEHGDGEHSEHH
jgi:caa(3)-type oxidase subunit IV